MKHVPSCRPPQRTPSRPRRPVWLVSTTTSRLTCRMPTLISTVPPAVSLRRPLLRRAGRPRVRGEPDECPRRRPVLAMRRERRSAFTSTVSPSAGQERSCSSRWPRGRRSGSRRRRRSGRPGSSSRFSPTGIGSSGSGPLAGPTKVPLADSRSSTHQRVPSVVSWACRRLTPESAPQSMSGWMLRLREARPTSTTLRAAGRPPAARARAAGRGSPGLRTRRVDPDLGHPAEDGRVGRRRPRRRPAAPRARRASPRRSAAVAGTRPAPPGPVGGRRGRQRPRHASRW